ncbi:MAG: succinate dehydrogenase cytochrome b subunit [Saprospiraceae bacterium]|nr:succinate dehydrogenase cytochrome b subunit [Saprospiraceae bacterium]
MSWLTKFLTSSIGQKFVMALSGIFLMLFLIVHLIGNLQLLNDDGGESFNAYAHFMTHNPLIKIVSYLLYASILLHAIQGLLLWQHNKASRGAVRYAVNHVRSSEISSRNMAWLGIVILVFLILHMYQYWFQMHWGNVPFIEYSSLDHPVKDLYALVGASYQNLGYVLFYVICMGVVSYHLWHGFWSSFQTLGLNHRKYTPIIKGLGIAYSIGVPVLFAVIPVWMYIK